MSVNTSDSRLSFNHCDCLTPKASTKLRESYRNSSAATTASIRPSPCQRRKTTHVTSSLSSCLSQQSPHPRPPENLAPTQYSRRPRRRRHPNYLRAAAPQRHRAHHTRPISRLANIEAHRPRRQSHHSSNPRQQHNAATTPDRKRVRAHVPYTILLLRHTRRSTYSQG